jgi:Flp pilus assembly protein TadG
MDAPTCGERSRRIRSQGWRRRAGIHGSNRHDGGQATVEFALALPILLIVVLGLTQVGVAIRNELAVELAAREGARAAAVSANPAGAAAAAATTAVALPIAVSTSSNRSNVTVTVTYVDPTNVAIIGHFIGPTTHSATVTMAVEPP